MTPCPPEPVLSPNPSIAPGYELTVVAPSFNEAANLPILVERLKAALCGVSWQLIIVDDDSPDGAAMVGKRLAQEDARITCIRRIGRRGLAGAVIEGVLASAAPYVAVIDADMQHDETLLPAMLDALRGGLVDLVIGSRYIGGGSAGGGFSKARGLGSAVAARLARMVLRADVTDPVSGFFMARRAVVDEVAPRLSSQGFKILFDIIASQRQPLRILELPYAFAERQSGESKLDRRVIVEYFGLIVSKLSGNLIPPRAWLFGIVGVSGVFVNLAAVRVGLGLHLEFAMAQALAAFLAMTSNYLINNEITYRDRRLKGLSLLKGYLRFCALCSVGLLANVAVANLVEHWLGIWLAASLAGALFGAVWNYVSTSLAVW